MPTEVMYASSLTRMGAELNDCNTCKNYAVLNKPVKSNPDGRGMCTHTVHPHPGSRAATMSCYPMVAGEGQGCTGNYDPIDPFA